MPKEMHKTTSGAVSRVARLTDAEKLAKVRALAQHGTPKQRAKARFYLQALRPAAERRKRG